MFCLRFMLFPTFFRIKQFGGGLSNIKKIILFHVFFAFYAISNIFSKLFVGGFFCPKYISCFMRVINAK